MKRKICVITGTRADYGILRSVMEAIRSSAHLKLYVVATGMHLMREFGYTLREINKDGFKVYAKINISYQKDTGEAMAKSVGKAVSLFADCFNRLKPQVVVVLGDRGEMLAAAIAADYLNIPVAHIHGGEVSGHIDGVLRHAITKLSALHFPATKRAGERIIKLGENSWRVKIVGAPALDRVANKKLPDRSYLTKKYNLDRDKPFAILAQHPVSTETKKAGGQIKLTLQALNELKIPTIVVYPNADAGGRKMIGILKEYSGEPLFKIFKSLPHIDYLGLMSIASVLIGNTSSGIIEAPAFKLPVVNIGNRQKGRECSTNVLHVPNDKKVIKKAIKKALYDKGHRAKLKECKNPYWNGGASKKIVRILSGIKLGPELLQKQITY